MSFGTGGSASGGESTFFHVIAITADTSNTAVSLPQPRRFLRWAGDKFPGANLMDADEPFIGLATNTSKVARSKAKCSKSPGMPTGLVLFPSDAAGLFGQYSAKNFI